MLTYEASERISATEALQNPWLTNYKMTVRVNEKDMLIALNSLKNFRTQTKLQAAVLSFITSQHLPKEEEARISELFKTFDKDQKGELTKDELEGVLKLMYGNSKKVKKEVDEICKNLNLKGRGTISYNGILLVLL